MATGEAEAAAAARPETARFLRFCAVGAAGFLIDAAVLAAGIRLAGLDPVAARAISFAVAVLATFELNRRWAFRDARRRRYAAALAAYLSVQGVGFLCNFGVYVALYKALPRPLNAPLLCLVAASALALIVNYAGARAIVFRRAAPRSPNPAESG